MIKKHSQWLLEVSRQLLVWPILFIYVAVLSVTLIIPAEAGVENQEPSAILVLGDSLSAAYGINTAEGWVTLLQQQIHRQGYAYEVVNASVSGDTTRTGLSRLKSALQQHQPDIIIIALGGNDGLRGLAFSEIESSLASAIELSQHHGAEVLLAGVRLPPNYGLVYSEKFAAIYRGLAEHYKVSLVPKMLDQVADYTHLMQQDGMHPTATAQPVVMMNIWPKLEALLIERAN